MVTIRSEIPGDYFPIAELHALAFTNNLDLTEVVIVDGHRRMPEYDPNLSLVAEMDGRVVGHVLFHPYIMRMDGEDIKAVCLSPIAVHPDYQKKGIGGKLVLEGLNRAKKKGYQMSFLIGHSSYYPKFGYQTNMFGTCSIKINSSDIKETEAVVKERRVQEPDLPLLKSMWEEWYGQVDLSIVPGPSVLHWINHGLGRINSVVTINEEVEGFLSYEAMNPLIIQQFLSTSKEATKAILSYMTRKSSSLKEGEISIAVHPEAPITESRIPYPYQASIKTYDTGMIKPLNEENEIVLRYCDEVSKGERTPGLLIWPTPFQL
ncbi:N-acetyltransferase [Bacillaceae bacterium S4-13-56]